MIEDLNSQMIGLATAVAISFGWFGSELRGAQIRN